MNSASSWLAEATVVHRDQPTNHLNPWNFPQVSKSLHQAVAICGHIVALDNLGPLDRYHFYKNKEC